MSRRGQLINRKRTNVTGLYLANIPDALLANDYVKMLSIAINAGLAEMHVTQQKIARIYDITRNL